jgi:hypothetical protein
MPVGSGCGDGICISAGGMGAAIAGLGLAFRRAGFLAARLAFFFAPFLAFFARRLERLFATLCTEPSWNWKFANKQYAANCIGQIQKHDYRGASLRLADGGAEGVILRDDCPF